MNIFRASVAMAASFLACGASGARAADRPICSRPEVLTFVMDQLHSKNAHIALVPGSAVEVGTSRDDIVLCAISVRVETYDAGDYRLAPAAIAEPRTFEVKRLRDGFELDFTGR